MKKGGVLLMNVIAAFKSKNQMMSFDMKLRRIGIATQIIPTPRSIALGCGLSVEFDEEHLLRAKEIIVKTKPTAFEGFFGLFNENSRINIRKIY